MTKLITRVVSAIERSQRGIVARVGKYLSALRPIITFHPATNLPTVEVQVYDGQQVKSFLEVLMEMLGDLI
jgi:hypothetical protein